MYISDEQTQETTYAGKQFVQSTPVASSHIIMDEKPSDRNAEIYSYLTLVAERCHDARITRVEEVNNPLPKGA